MLSALNSNTVTNHIAKYNYGIVYWTSFVSGVHHEQDMIYDKLECCWKADNQMAWYLKKVCYICGTQTLIIANRAVKGANILKTDPVRREFYQCLTGPEELANLSSIILYSPVNNPGSRKNQGWLICNIISYSKADRDFQ